MKRYLVIVPVFVSFAAAAQTVPAIDKTASVGTSLEMHSAPIQLSAKERYALDQAKKWKESPDKPAREADGSLKYLYGATLPTLICTPLHTCLISLQPGEIVSENGIHAGDRERWKITPSIVGAAPMTTTLVVVKPTESGLVTNLIINTDRRSYMVLLKSAKREWMPKISFHYPDEEEHAWREYRANQVRVTQANTMSTGQNASALDFNFRMAGDNPKWKPQRVYTDGVKTYIQFPSANFTDEAPALVAFSKDESLWSSPTPQLVNYRLIGDRYVVDKVLRHGALISGVGKEQIKVTIDYLDGGKSQ